MKHIPQLDGIRCFAIISVIIGHWIAWDTSNVFVKNFPWSHGVLLFFVLSGYLITTILLGLKEKIEASQISLKKALSTFYFRRFIRIFPIYYLTIFYLFFIDYKNTGELFPWLVTYTSNILQALSGKYPGDFTHFWSLAIEEQFYLFWPFFILIVSRKYLLKGMYLAIVLSFLSRLYCVQYYGGNWMMGSYFSLNLVLPLSLGGLVAYYRRYRNPAFDARFVRRGFFYLSGTLYFVFFCLAKKNNWYFLTALLDQYLFSVFAMFFVAIAAASKFRSIEKILLENRVVVYIGTISYGLYVYHMFMSALYFDFVAPKLSLSIDGKGTIWLLYFVLLFCVSTISYYLVEKPLNSLKKYFSYTGTEIPAPDGGVL